MDALHAFLDESGSPSFPIHDGHPTHYAIAAVLVPASRLAEVREEAEGIRRRHFQTGEMKSDGLRSNSGRRLRILRDIAALDVSLAALVVDKRRIIEGSPLYQWQRSFVKFIGGKLYADLFRLNREVHIVADERDGPAYREEFQRYVQQRHKPDLFGPASSFEFQNSKAEPLIQVADFVAGALRIAAEQPTDNHLAFVDALSPRLHHYASWPFNLLRRRAALEREATLPEDALIQEYALTEAARFLDEHDGAQSTAVQVQVACLNYLLYANQFEEEDRFVSSAELIQHIGAFSGASDEHALRTGVIAPLRDAGVMIASGPKGFKIPDGVDDLTVFARQTAGQVMPMMRRLQRYRTDLLMRSGGTLDILDFTAGDQAQRLRLLLDEMKTLALTEEPDEEQP